MELKNNMKLIIYLIMFCVSCSVHAQTVSKKCCKTCGKVLSSCSFRGQHPQQSSNRPSNKVRPDNSQRSKPDVEGNKRTAEPQGADAQFNLGLEYYDYENYAEAVKWYRKSAEQGYVAAQFNLGWCYENGLGVEKNSTEAWRWYQYAAEQGDSKAQAALKRLQ